MPRTPKLRSAMTNGTRTFLRPLAGNTEGARRYKDVLASLLAERGGAGAMPVVAQEACRTYAGLVVMRDEMQADLAEGKPVDAEALGQIGDRMSRQAVKMGPVRAPTRETLEQRLARRSDQ